MAAAPAQRPAARGRLAATRRSRSCSRRCASACRTSSTCPALLGADARIGDRDGPARRGRDPASRRRSRAVAALRLRRRVHVRGRLPARRAPRRGALARPGPARRAARPRRAARAARPRRARRDRGRAAAARPRTAGPATARASPTCCGCSARCPTDEVAGRGAGRRRRRRRLAVACSSSRAGRARADRAARSAGPPSRTPAGCATRSACRCRPATPDAFTEPVADPLGDLVGRYARTHGPFTAADVATRLGLGVAVCPTDAAPARRPAAGCSRASSGRRASGAEWCDAEVLRMLRRRSLARLRHEVEPVEPAALARFLPAWQHVPAQRGRPRGVDGRARAVEQLAGCAVPASALESLVLPARVADYSPALLDELTATGEVLWAGHGALPGHDGWVSLHLGRHRAADPAADRRRARAGVARGPRGGARRARAAAAPASSARWPRATGASDDARPGRRALGSGLGRPRHQRHPRPAARADRRARGAHRTRRRAPRARARATARPTRRCGPLRRPSPGAGALLPEREHRPHPARPRRRRADCSTATASSPAARSSRERTPGGFAAVYKVLSAFEEAGRCRRGYFVEGLGAAQFGTAGRGRPAAHLRRAARPPPTDAPTASRRPSPLAATDPANPYGAALPWPDRETRAATGPAARPARSSCSSTARSRSTSSAAARPCSPGPTTPTLLGPAAQSLSAARSPRGPRPADRREGRRRAASSGQDSDALCARRSTRPASSPHRAGCGCVPEGDTVWRAAPRSDRALSRPGAHRAPTSGCPSLATRDLSGATVSETVLARQAPADPDRRRAA